MGLPYANLILIILGSAFVLGAALAIRGLRGRRVGTEPHCRRCGYDLTGGPQRCPECGTEAVGKNVVIGVRQRFWKSACIGLGLLFLVIASVGSALYGKSRGINWYPYLPEFVLVFEAEGDNSGAIEELVARYNSGSTKGSTLLRLVPQALARQSTVPRHRSARAWTDLLATMESAGGLTPEQRVSFYDHIVSVAMELRSKVRRGEELTFSFSFETLGSPRLPGTLQIEDGELRIGGWAREYAVLGFNWLASQGAYASSGFHLPTDQFEPGTYPVELRANKVFNSASITCPIYLQGELTVLAPESPDTLRLVDEPALMENFENAIAITISNKSFGAPPRRGYSYLELTVDKGVPMDAVFDVIVRAGTEQLHLGPFTIKKSASAGDTWHLSCPREFSPGECFVPILRTNAEVARKSADLFEIWDGEIVFDPICLSGEPASSFANTSGLPDGEGRP